MVEPFPWSRRKFIGGCLAGLVSSSAPRCLAQTDPLALQKVDFSNSEKAELRKTALDFMDQFLVPGLSVAIAKNGKLAFHQAFGWTDPLKQERLTTAHRFRIASLSKPLTSAAIFRLIQAGKLTLWDKIFSMDGILRSLVRESSRNKFLEQVTVDHLLSHMVGAWPNDQTDPMIFDPALTREDLLNHTLQYCPLKKPPGSDHRYSNFGYFVLGRVIEALTQLPYREAMDRLVFAPCGMRSLQLAKNTLRERQDWEVTYFDQEGDDPYAMNLERLDAAGGLIATADDLARFLVQLDSSGKNPRFLGSDYVQLMTTPLSPNYARGWCVNRWNNWWHLGSLPGTVAFMVHSSDGFCMVALANTRTRKDEMQASIDQMTRRMVNGIKQWPNINLFT